MSRINTNVASLRGLRNYNKSNKLLDTSLTRLSTGLQINTGKDNPSGLIASETLRLEITTIEQSIKNSNRANNVIATADGALGEISGLLNQIRGLVQEGLNDGALSQAEKEANQLQIDTALSAINRISSNTKFAGDKLIDGSKAFNTSTSVADASKLTDYKVNEAILGTNTSLDVKATVTSVAEKAELRYTAGNLRSAVAIEVGGSKGNEILFLGDSATTTDIRDAVNNLTDATGVTARVLSGAGASVSGDTATITEPATASAVTIDGAGANDALTFTRVTAGSDADIGGPVSVDVVDPGVASQAFSIAVAGNAITINLATDAGGAVTTTADDIVTAINAHAQAGALVQAEATEGDGSGAVADSGGAQNLVGGTSEATLNLTDIRADSSSGPLEVEFVSSGVADAAVDVQVSGNTLRVIAGTLATVADVVTQFQADTDSRDMVQATASGDTTNLIDTGGDATEFTSGTAGSIAVNDIRGSGATGTINLAFANPGAASQPLSVAVTTAGNDTTVTVNLATNANGEVISTLEEIATAIGSTTAAIADGTALNDAVEVVVDGDGTKRVGALASTALNEANGLTIALESADYGSAETVNVNVLSGSFQTYTSDYSAPADLDAGVDIGLTINGQEGTGKGLSGRIRNSLLDASLEFAEASNVVGETATVSINGGGSLFQIGPDVSAAGQIGVGLEAINTARLGGSAGKLYELGTGNGKSLLDVGSGGISGSELVGIIDEALERVTTLRGRLGALQKNVIETNISTLGVALENISEARSQITDTDFAVETAALTKAQVLQQSGIAVLTIANQNPQQVLSLLG